MNFRRLSVLFVCLLAVGELRAGCEQLAVDTSLGTVRDITSGMTWSRCLFGQVGQGCLGDGAVLSWVDAMNKARGMELGGLSHWRLPQIEEFEKLFAIGPACLAQAFPGGDSAITWSASANLDYATDAWSFDLGRGEAIVMARDRKLRLRMIADPK
jgi:hypothetical protein